MESGRDNGVRTGVSFSPLLRHGMWLETRLNLARFQAKVKYRFLGFHRSPQQAECLAAVGEQLSNVRPQRPEPFSLTQGNGHTALIIVNLD